MRRTLIAVALSLVIGPQALLACGDKFFLVGQGARFSRAYATLHPGSILVYTGGASEISKGLADARLHKFITHAGHRVIVARNPGELGHALGAGAVDVILADLDEAVALVPRAASAPSRPALLPFEGKRGAARAGLSHPFAVTVKSSDKINHVLARIEEVMKGRNGKNGRRS